MTPILPRLYQTVPPRQRLRLLSIAMGLVLTATALWPGETAWAADDKPLWPPIVERHNDALGSLSSESDARVLFLSTLAPALNLKDLPLLAPKRQAAKNQIDELLTTELTDAAARLTSALAAERLARQLEAAASGLDAPALLAALQRSTTQQRWLLADQTRPDLAQALTMAQADPPGSADPPDRLARLAAQAVRAQAEAETAANEAWARLAQWRDRARELRGLARLCGSWHWTVHNHQNHQDHKLVMVFDPPVGIRSANGPSTPTGAEAGASRALRPSKIVVLGDALYLRWEQGGTLQEDSLLFVGEGQRIEGSFVTSSGAWGSITGKRAAACSFGK